MSSTETFDGFLTDDARQIFDLIKAHCEELEIWEGGYLWELTLLANSLALYRTCAIEVKEKGISEEVGENGYQQLVPAYTVMKNEYQNILKHASKFALNPYDLKRIIGKRPKDAGPFEWNLTSKKDRDERKKRDAELDAI